MTQLDTFIEKLLKAAAEAGIDPAEVYCAERSAFSAEAMEGNIESYEVSETCALGLRGVVGGKTGYASTEAFDDEAIRMLVRGVQESAALVEAEEQDEIYAGDPDYPAMETPENDLDEVTPEEKLQFALAMEKSARAADARITKSNGSYVATGRGTLRLVNSYGLNLKTETPPGGYAVAGIWLIGKDGDSTVTGGNSEAGRKFRALDPAAIGKKAAEETTARLNASPVESGVYRAVIRRDAMKSLLRTFAGIFSAENAQKKMSLLEGREGEAIAAPCVTLMDDPLLPGGFASAAFDGEGSASRTKAVIENGVLKTLLHSRKTARKAGTESTGNAQRSVSSPVTVAPTNFFFRPGEKDLDGLLADMGEGLLITELGGLHAGANPVSGDFSLIAKGFRVKDGKQGAPVEQVTIAGNFYQLLKDIRAVGSDLEFKGSGIGSPSVDAGTIHVAGK